MQQFTTADWVVVATFAVGAFATFIAAWLARRDRDAEPEKPIVHLHDEDRTTLHRVIDTIHRGVTRIEDALSEHRRALDDNSDHLKRNRKDCD